MVCEGERESPLSPGNLLLQAATGPFLPGALPVLFATNSFCPLFKEYASAPCEKKKISKGAHHSRALGGAYFPLPNVEALCLITLSGMADLATSLG